MRDPSKAEIRALIKKAPKSARRCGCPEQYAGRHCPACHGTGLIWDGQRDLCFVCKEMDERPKRKGGT